MAEEDKAAVERRPSTGNNVKAALYVVHVSECGSVGARGIYRPTGKKRNSQPILENENGFTLSREKLDTIGWIIGKKVGGMHCAHYAVASAELEPPVDGWKAFEGAEPLPMLIVKHNKPAGAVPTSAAVSAAAAASAAHRARPPQPAITATLSSTNSVETENSRQRNRLYERVIYTERDYGTYLSKILSFVVEPMRVARTAPKGFEDLIACFTDVLASHSAILSYIHRRVDTRPSQVISGVFIEHVATLRSYVKYFVQFPSFLDAARKCLGDMRTLGADATFRGDTLPVILFRPVLRLFEYEFYLRNLLHFTDRAHQFHSSFQKAHSFVLSALKELQQVMGKDTANHVGDLMKVCSQLQIPSLILPGRRYNSTWTVLRCSVGATEELFGGADLHVFTDMLCLVPASAKPASPDAAARRDDMLTPEVVLYHCDLTALKLLPPTAMVTSSTASSPANKSSGAAGKECADDSDAAADTATVSIHLNDAFRKAPRVFNLVFAQRQEASDFVMAFEALLRAPEVKFGLPAPEASYPTVKFFIAPPPPTSKTGTLGGSSSGSGTGGSGTGGSGTGGSSGGGSSGASSALAAAAPGRTRNWASHRNKGAAAAGGGATTPGGGGSSGGATAGDFKAAVEHKTNNATAQQQQRRRPSSNSSSIASGGGGSSTDGCIAAAAVASTKAAAGGARGDEDDDDDDDDDSGDGGGPKDRTKDCLYRLNIYRELISTEQTCVVASCPFA
jgi:uncharacterized membrane protein YgcG